MGATTKKKTTKAKAGKKPARKTKPAVLPTAPVVAPDSPENFRARVRMYRHGLGDCFLVTFPRKHKDPFHMLIDCGALARDKTFMTGIVEHIRDTIRNGETTDKARLDVVVATHEHKDHVSGFNQARDVFNRDFDFGSVWLAWTENLTKPEIKKFKEAKSKAVSKLREALSSPLAAAAGLQGVEALLGFSEEDDTTGSGLVSEAMEYLKLRGKDSGNLRYCEPGGEPFALDGVEGVRVYVLGPSHDPGFMKVSEVTEQMKKDEIVYHLTATGDAGMDALGAAISTLAGGSGGDQARYLPFSSEHRIPRKSPDGRRRNPYFASIRKFVSRTYDDPKQNWRQIENDWLAAFGQLALDLDNDTNNTSLVLAFEFVKTGEVLLFVGDAQVGNWKSWANVEFTVPGRDKPRPAHDLLSHAVFYKVGHHCSHNATLKRGGLELMNRNDLVAFIPLDKQTAKKQGAKGWDMPAGPLFKALKEKTSDRVALSDVTETLTTNAKQAGIRATDAYIDYFLT
jgi:beta-lactamase superfamily II metal-dependent hydrolase